MNSINDFYNPFGGHLSNENFWVKLKESNLESLSKEISKELFNCFRIKDGKIIKIMIVVNILEVKNLKEMENIIDTDPSIQYFMGANEYNPTLSINLFETLSEVFKNLSTFSYINLLISENIEFKDLVKSLKR
jgi:hypothetical protein